MRVESYKENEDGSATVILDLTKEEVSLLIESSLVAALEQYLEKSETDPRVRMDRPDIPSNSFEV